jgi:hypothetical protein
MERGKVRAHVEWRNKKMTKSVISFIIQVRLYNKDNPNGFLFPFQVLEETESKARKLLERYLTEKKKVRC